MASQQPTRETRSMRRKRKPTQCVPFGPKQHTRTAPPDGVQSPPPAEPTHTGGSARRRPEPATRCPRSGELEARVAPTRTCTTATTPLPCVVSSVCCPVAIFLRSVRSMNDIGRRWPPTSPFGSSGWQRDCPRPRRLGRTAPCFSRKTGVLARIRPPCLRQDFGGGPDWRFRWDCPRSR